MATGGPLDAQRERRWPPPPPEPGQPPKKTVKVEDWAPEDASDYEDMETVLAGWQKLETAPAITGVASAEHSTEVEAEQTTDHAPEEITSPA